MAGDPLPGRQRRHSVGGFNPRPPSMAGDPALSPPRIMSRVCFNPRPPSMAGDPVLRVGVHGHFSGFQSAPAIDGGRSTQKLIDDAATDVVSIRARHRWRAIPYLTALREDVQPVSIRARHRWRAIRMHAALLLTSSGFQSAPAIDGGRSACYQGHHPAH